MGTHFLLIRHAIADTGRPPRLCGTFDAPLSQAGIAQLQALLRDADPTAAPDALYTSPLRRARETAVACARAWRLPVQVDLAFQEIHCGSFEGLPLDEIRTTHPEVWARNNAQDDDAFRWPDGESYAEFRGRILGGLSRLAAVHRGRRVAVITHSGVVAQVLGTLRGRPAAVWEHDRPAPLSATHVLWGDTEPLALLAFNSRDWCRESPQLRG